MNLHVTPHDGISSIKTSPSQKILLVYFINPYLIAEFSIIIAAIINSDTSQH